MEKEFLDSEEQLLRFLDKLNQCHEAIRFTNSYSKTDAIFSGCELEKVLCWDLVY